MRPIFVFIKAALGKTYVVAEDLVDTIEETSEVFSVSGKYDLLVRFNLPSDIDVGRFVTERLQTRPHIVDTETLMTFKAFSRDAMP